MVMSNRQHRKLFNVPTAEPLRKQLVTNDKGNESLRKKTATLSQPKRNQLKVTSVSIPKRGRLALESIDHPPNNYLPHTAKPGDVNVKLGARKKKPIVSSSNNTSLNIFTPLVAS